MITLTLEWREVLWWMQGGMAGSHLRWSVYEDMINKVWPQCSEQERRNLWFVMRRELGYTWRPDGWSGFDRATAHGEGEWKPESEIYDKTPWTYFRQVLARFDPENQYAVRIAVHSQKELSGILCLTPQNVIIERPNLSYFDKDEDWESDTTNVTVRTYKWQDLNGKDAYFIDWSRRCDPDRISKVERIDIPDNGTM